MKIILSRKGFDAAAGGVPSLILQPDQRLISLPIPETEPDRPPRRYAEVRAGPATLDQLVRDLAGGRFASERVHLDPDLTPGSLPETRPPGWRPAFGQAGAAEQHLRRMGVGAGDLFLFFGWFRAVEQCGDTFRYVPGSPDLHVLFGWLQIERRIRHDAGDPVPPWATGHPHGRPRERGGVDSLYVAGERLRVPGLDRALPGAGKFPHVQEALQLTAAGQHRRSVWRLPTCFVPPDGRPRLSYHTNPARWSMADDGVRLQTVGRGQEFVIDCDDIPEVVAWLRDVMECADQGAVQSGYGGTESSPMV